MSEDVSNDEARSDVNVGCTGIGMGEPMRWASSCGYEREGGLGAEQLVDTLKGAIIHVANANGTGPEG